jgi:hypothetical protein
VASSDDIEDRFASAVKSALDASDKTSPDAPTIPVQVDSPRRSRLWGVALLCLAVSVIAVVVVATALYVRRSDVRRSSAEIAATQPPGSTIATTPEASAGEGSVSTTVTPSTFASAPASASTASAAEVSSSAAERSATAAAAPTVEVSNTPASIVSAANELQQLHATPSAPPRRGIVSRSLRRPAAAGDVALPRGAQASSPKSSVKRQLVSSQSSNPAREPTTAAGSTVSAGAAVESPIPRATAAPSARPAIVAGSGAPTVSSVATRAVLVPSPDRSVYWALEASGTIFRSTDGKSWQKQDSGVQSDLLAGRAPTNTVCWVVGRSGTILLTTDGTRWQRIKSPTNADLVSVSADSADVADSVTADGSRLSTFDRGSNWTPTAQGLTSGR